MRMGIPPERVRLKSSFRSGREDLELLDGRDPAGFQDVQTDMAGGDRREVDHFIFSNRCLLYTSDAADE